MIYCIVTVCVILFVFFFKQKTAYEMRISDWSSDVCSSDLSDIHLGPNTPATARAFHQFLDKACAQADALILCGDLFDAWIGDDLALSSPPPWLAETLEKFHQVAKKIPLWLGRGNRDFLMGTVLAEHVGDQEIGRAHV